MFEEETRVPGYRGGFRGPPKNGKNMIFWRFIGRGNRSIRRKPPTCGKSLTNYPVSIFICSIPISILVCRTSLWLLDTMIVAYGHHFLDCFIVLMCLSVSFRTIVAIDLWLLITPCHSLALSNMKCMCLIKTTWYVLFRLPYHTMIVSGRVQNCIYVFFEFPLYIPREP